MKLHLYTIAFFSVSLLQGAAINPSTFQDLPPWVRIANGCRGGVTGLCFDDAGTDAFDGGGHLRVNGQSYSAANPSDLTGNTYTGGTSVMSNLEVSLQYTLVEPTILRAVATFTNPTLSLITTTFEMESNSGADNGMQFVATSSGDTTFTVADMWVVVDDTDLNGNDTSAVYVLFGPGAVSTPTGALGTASIIAFGAEGVRSQFGLSVAPGETVRYMFFFGLNATATGATALAAQFNANPGASLLAGLTQAELDSIRNFNLSNSEAVPEPGSLGFAAAGLTALLLYRGRRS